MRLSVGIPAYNQGEYLGETIASVLAQDPAPHEVVVSDNHSTDATADVIRSFGDAVRVVRPPEHLAMSHHWNFVVRQTDGDWFSLLSSDDIALPGYCRELVEAAISVQDAVLVHGGYEVIDEGGAVLDTGIAVRTGRVRRPPDTLTEQLLGPIVNFASFAVRRSAWDAVGGFPQETILYSDWGMWLRLVPQGAFVYVPRAISGYRVYPRAEENSSRLIPQVRDLVWVEADLLPEVARAVGLPERDLLRAGRTRLLDQLAALHGLDGQRRAEATALLSGLAERFDCRGQLELFAAGGRITESGRVRKALVRTIRPPLALLARVARGRQ